MEFTRRGGQHGVGGTSPGRLHRSHRDEVVVERSGRLPRYKADCLHFKHPVTDAKQRPGFPTSDIKHLAAAPLNPLLTELNFC